MKTFLSVFYIICGFALNRPQVQQCHDDPNFTIEEGPLEYIQFTWLGTLQYIHIKNGTPHYFRIPRVVLISRQFVLSTARDATEVPEGFALGNIAFGEYERDENECGLTLESITADDPECSSAAVLMPVADVLLHPRLDSIAILKLLIKIRSRYMVPVCLPLQNYFTTRSRRQNIMNNLYLVDFEADVPRDIAKEDKQITKLSLLPSDLCYLDDGAKNITIPYMDKVMCTSGCGFHFGAASIFHEHTGHWTLIALSLGGTTCPDPLRSSRQHGPPHHVLIHPYVPWITATVTGKGLGPEQIDKQDPFGFVVRSAPEDETFGHVWSGHWWMGGISCFLRGEAADSLFKFYHEIFQVKPGRLTNLTYYLELHAAYGCSVSCVKVGLPYQIAKPKVWGLDTPQVKIRIPVLGIKGMYRFQVEAFAYNVSSDSSYESEGDDQLDY